MFRLPTAQRRIVYVLSFEVLAILSSTFLLKALNHGEDGGSPLALAVAISVIAVVWNFLFNTAFEAAERRYATRGRTIGLRVLHALGFEGGLVLFTVPLIMVWFGLSFVPALMLEAALLVFFLVFTFFFTLAFDRIFALPEGSAAPKTTAQNA